MDNIEELTEIFAKETDKKRIRKLMQEILTPAELTDLAKRWFLMKELYNGKAQRKIAKEMEISLCKITRGSKILKDSDSEFRKILGQMYDENHI